MIKSQDTLGRCALNQMEFVSMTKLQGMSVYIKQLFVGNVFFSHYILYQTISIIYYNILAETLTSYFGQLI